MNEESLYSSYNLGNRSPILLKFFHTKIIK